MRSDHPERRAYLAPALGLVLAAAISACSSGSSGSSSSPVPSSPAQSTPPVPPSASSPASGGPAAAITEIKANWIKFFSSSTPNSERVALLQNGQTFAAAIKSFAANPLAAQVASKVDSVALTSATQAAVKYDLTAGGTSVASGQTGTSVLQGGTWKVGDDVFCGLLKEGASLAGMTVPAACK